MRPTVKKHLTPGKALYFSHGFGITFNEQTGIVPPADCVLLIAAALSPAELTEFLALARHIDIDALVEVHDEAELAVALDAGATLVGVNQRDLVTFQVDQERAVRMGSLIPSHLVKVAESGVRGRDDALALRAAGYDAVLVGEHLVTSEDPSRALTDLCVD